MAKEITLSKVKVNNIQIGKLPVGYSCTVGYSVQNNDGSESFTLQSSKFTSDSSESPKLSVGSDALVVNFVNAITTLMGDREDL